MALGNVNVDTVTTSTSGGVLGAGNASIMKNRIINGAMVIDQRNAGASVTPTTGVYTLDRWVAIAYSASSKFSVQQNAGSVTPPVGFTNYLGITSTSAYSVASGDFLTMEQHIEGYNVADLGWGTANAKTVTLSFWVRSSLTGNFGGALANQDGSRSYPFIYTISSANTWEQKSITIVGDNTGTWLTTNGLGLSLRFALGVGSTYSGTAGTWAAGANYFSATGTTNVVATNGATLYITGVQLEVGSSATGFEYVNYQTSLANCQRYYWKTSIPNTITTYTMGGFVGSNNAWFALSYKVPMRSAPTFTSTSSGFWMYNLGSGANSANTSLSTFQATTDFTYFAGAGSGGGASGGTVAALGGNSSGSYIDASAEL